MCDVLLKFGPENLALFKGDLYSDDLNYDDLKSNMNYTRNRRTRISTYARKAKTVRGIGALCFASLVQYVFCLRSFVRSYYI